MCATHATRNHPTSQTASQRGSIVIMTAGVILLGLILLGGLQLGYTFYVKRTLQNAADLAAISGAQTLYNSQGDPDCSQAAQTAQAIIQDNLSVLTASAARIVQCGQWDPEIISDTPHFQEGATAVNAVRVILTHTAAAIMPFTSSSTLEASAIATNTRPLPIAAFSVGPRLLDISNGIVPALLQGIGLNPDYATVLNHQGLANIRITPSGLLDQLGIEVPLTATVGDLEQLLNASTAPTLMASQILDASIRAADQQGLLDAERLTVLNALVARLQVEDLALNLLRGSGDTPGLLSLGNIDSPAGLDAQIGLGDILEVILSAANMQRGIDLAIPGINLPGFSLNSHIGIVEPPSIGIGPVGTTAHSANIRAFVHMCLLSGCSSQSTLATRLLPLDIGVNLPLVVEASNGTGELLSITPRQETAGAQASIGVQADLLTACVGQFGTGPGAPGNAFSTRKSCAQQISDNPASLRASAPQPPFLNVKLPLLSPLTLTEPVAVPGLHTRDQADFSVGQTRFLPPQGNELALGTTLNTLSDTLLTTLADLTLGSSRSVPNATGMATELWDQAKIDCPSCNRRQLRRNILDNLKSGAEEVKRFSLLGAVVGLVNGVLGLVGNLLDGVLGLVYDPCGGSLLNPSGTDSGCINQLATHDLLKKSSSHNGIHIPNILIPLLGSVLSTLTDLLAPALNALGTQLVHPLLDVLGLNIGQVEVTLISIDERPSVRLVH